MRESYDEGIASHVGPGSCAGAREGSGEALTGVRVGRVLSREMVEGWCVGRGEEDTE